MKPLLIISDNKTYLKEYYKELVKLGFNAVDTSDLEKIECITSNFTKPKNSIEYKELLIMTPVFVIDKKTHTVFTLPEDLDDSVKHIKKMLMHDTHTQLLYDVINDIEHERLTHDMLESIEKNPNITLSEYLNQWITIDTWLNSLKIAGIKPLLTKIYSAKRIDTKMGYIDQIFAILDANDIDYAEREDDIKELSID